MNYVTTVVHDEFTGNLPDMEVLTKRLRGDQYTMRKLGGIFGFFRHLVLVCWKPQPRQTLLSGDSLKTAMQNELTKRAVENAVEQQRALFLTLVWRIALVMVCQNLIWTLVVFFKGFQH